MTIREHLEENVRQSAAFLARGKKSLSPTAHEACVEKFNALVNEAAAVLGEASTDAWLERLGVSLA